MTDLTSPDRLIVDSHLYVRSEEAMTDKQAVDVLAEADRAAIEAPWREALADIEGTLADLGRVMLREEAKDWTARDWDAIGTAIGLTVSMIGPIRALLAEQDGAK